MYLTRRLAECTRTCAVGHTRRNGLLARDDDSRKNHRRAGSSWKGKKVEKTHFCKLELKFSR
jgi:hypothetical protein